MPRAIPSASSHSPALRIAGRVIWTRKTMKNAATVSLPSASSHANRVRSVAATRRVVAEIQRNGNIRPLVEAMDGRCRNLASDDGPCRDEIGRQQRAVEGADPPVRRIERGYPPVCRHAASRPCAALPTGRGHGAEVTPVNGDRQSKRFVYLNGAGPEAEFRVPDAVRHSSCRSAEPGPCQAPVFVRPRLCSAPLRRATRCAASGERSLQRKIPPRGGTFLLSLTALPQFRPN